MALGLLAPPKAAVEGIMAITDYARTPQEIAFTSTWAKFESGFAEHVVAGRCRRWECDAHKLADGTIEHRARGFCQLHERAAGSDWDLLPGDIDAQARACTRMARWALGRCSGDARCAFRLLGGLPRDRKLRGEDARMAVYVRALEAAK
jgi:hypothetical protein